MIQHPHRSPLMLLLPSTTPGRWSIVLVITSLAALGVFFLMVGAGQRGGETLVDNWFLTGPMLVVAIAAIAGLMAAVVALARRDVYLLVVAPILWGLVVGTFILGEVVSPH
jgi:hypothetical protein